MRRCAEPGDFPYNDSCYFEQISMKRREQSGGQVVVEI